MDNILFKYLENRYNAEKELKKKAPGPVITISRQTGCSALDISEILCKNIQREFDVKWKIVDKEILNRSAQDLDNNHSAINQYFEAQEKSQLEEIIASLQSKKFHSDLEIKKTVSNVIKNIAQQGNVVIIGRGGVALSRDISRSLHVRIFAPYEWRLENVIRRFKMSTKEAEKFIEENDKKRQKLIEMLVGYKPKCLDSLFDVGYNRSKLLASEIANSIFNLAKDLKVFHDLI